MLTAITRAVSPAIANCQLSFIPRQPINLAKAREQHRAYEQLLEKLGARVVSLPADPDLPDSVFVEDPAVVLDELAVIFPLGAAVHLYMTFFNFCRVHQSLRVTPAMQAWLTDHVWTIEE